MLIKKLFFIPLAMAGTFCLANYASSAPCPEGRMVFQQAATQQSQEREVKEVQNKMKQVLHALRQNRQSAEILLQAAKEAGVPAEVVAEMEKMTKGFRQTFMTAVSPKQLIDAMLSDNSEGSQNLLIIGPDGSRWILMPTNKKPDAQEVAPTQPAAQNSEDMSNQALSSPQDVSRPETSRENIILKDGKDTPYWPTKEHLGKEGVLKYLEKLKNNL